MSDRYYVSEMSNRRKTKIKAVPSSRLDNGDDDDDKNSTEKAQESCLDDTEYYNSNKQKFAVQAGSGSDKRKRKQHHILWFLIWIILLFPIRLLFSTIAFLHGFISNIIVDIFTEGKGRRSKRVVWTEASERICNFVQKSGLQEEFNQGMNIFAIPNIRMINLVQRHFYPHGRQEACRLDNDDDNDNDKNTTIIANNNTHQAPDFAMLSRIMNYATAAYGQHMIASAVFEHGGRIPPPPHGKNMDHVCEHIGLLKEDIFVWEMDLGEDMDYLRHFCAVDHTHKQVVLAIRGTFSVTSTLVDLVGYCDDFCGGKAHSGMAKMARAIWKESGRTIMDKLDDLNTGNDNNGDNKKYELIITGHSLGAGVASLLNILLHHDEKKEQHCSTHNNIRCILFACPPTFYPLKVATQAVKHTIAVVHQNDVVPYLSIDAARRILRLMVTIENLKIPLWKKMAMDHELLHPIPHMLETCRSVDKAELPYMKGAPMVVIPANCVVWIHKWRQPRTILKFIADGAGWPSHNKEEEEYKVTFCDPHKLATVAPTFRPGNVNDHLVGRYEYALNSIATSSLSTATTEKIERESILVDTSSSI